MPFCQSREIAMCKSSKNRFYGSKYCISFGCSGAMAAVIEACKPGVKVVDLCETGDSFINSCVSSSLLYVYAICAYC